MAAAEREIGANPVLEYAGGVSGSGDKLLDHHLIKSSFYRFQRAKAI
jgi:hypothetical protein